MSIEAMKWAQKVAETGQLNTGQAFVLLLLGDHADESWSCFPSQELLGRDLLRLAYVATDGTPRNVPIAFLWDGTQLVMCTSTNAPEMMPPVLASDTEIKTGLGIIEDLEGWKLNFGP